MIEVEPHEPVRRRAHGRAADGWVTMRLGYRPPIELAGLLGFLGARAVPGIEEWDGSVYRRSLRLPNGPAVVELAGRSGHVSCRLLLADGRDADAAVARCRRLLDLDADPAAVDGQLGADPLLGPLVRRSPGRRVPAHTAGAVLAVRAVLGQQVSVAAARTVAARLVARYGRRLDRPVGAVDRLFPEPADLAAADPADLPMPAGRRAALVAVAGALAAGSLDLGPGADRQEAVRRLLGLPGVGPWTASYVAMRALGDRDAFLPTDLGVRRAVERLGLPGAPAAVAAIAERWRPWRAYATQHLWASLDQTLPGSDR